MRIYEGNHIIEYITNLYAKQNQILSDIEDFIKNNDQRINISAIEARFLQLLIKMNRIKTILEIGTHCGYSSLWMSYAIDEDGKIVTIERDLKRANIAKQFFIQANQDHKIEILTGDAIEILPNIQSKFDMIFIDANKAAYPIYLDWSEKYLKKGGIIVADNCLLSSAVCEAIEIARFSKKQVQNMRLFNDRISNRENYEAIMLPCFDGMTVAIKLF